MRHNKSVNIISFLRKNQKPDKHSNTHPVILHKITPIFILRGCCNNTAYPSVPCTDYTTLQQELQSVSAITSLSATRHICAIKYYYYCASLRSSLILAASSLVIFLFSQREASKAEGLPSNQKSASSWITLRLYSSSVRSALANDILPMR